MEPLLNLINGYINTNKLNNFERHLRNGHTQTLRHTEPPSNINKHKKSTNRDKERFNDLETSIDKHSDTDNELEKSINIGWLTH